MAKEKMGNKKAGSKKTGDEGAGGKMTRDKMAGDRKSGDEGNDEELQSGQGLKVGQGLQSGQRLQSGQGLKNGKSLKDGESFENVLMRSCRESRGYSPTVVAGKLGISLEMYRNMEKGDLLLTRKQAGQLGRLYEIKAVYFYREAIQLDLLLTRVAIIRILKSENDSLAEKIKEREGER